MSNRHADRERISEQDVFGIVMDIFRARATPLLRSRGIMLCGKTGDQARVHEINPTTTDPGPHLAAYGPDYYVEIGYDARKGELSARIWRAETRGMVSRIVVTDAGTGGGGFKWSAMPPYDDDRIPVWSSRRTDLRDLTHAEILSTVDEVLRDQDIPDGMYGIGLGERVSAIAIAAVVHASTTVHVDVVSASPDIFWHRFNTDEELTPGHASIAFLAGFDAVVLVSQADAVMSRSSDAVVASLSLGIAPGDLPGHSGKMRVAQVFVRSWTVLEVTSPICLEVAPGVTLVDIRSLTDGRWTPAQELAVIQERDPMMGAVGDA